MKKAKKLCALLIALSLMLATGCANQGADRNDTHAAADMYIEKAQKYIDEKDYAAAIDILQLGLETIDDEALEEMLDEVIELQIAEKTGDKTLMDANNDTDTEPQAFDISRYVSTVTYWASEGMDWIYGGYALGIYISETSPDNAYFEFSYLQSAPSSRNAVAATEIPLSEINSNEVTYSFENDGWGHSGNVTLTFEEDTILFAVSDVAYTDPACPEMWGFNDINGSLVSNPTIYDDLYYTEEEYNALFGEQEQTPQEPVYDTSKASGILASLGMTEQEFRDSCIPLINSYTEKKTSASNYLTLEDMLHYPNSYVGQFVVLSEVLWAKGICKYCGGNGDCQFESDQLSTHDEDGRHLMWQYYYDTLVPIEYRYSNKYMTNDGYQAYTLKSVFDADPYCFVFDYRDDIYSPNITSDVKIVPYMIFLGLSDTGNGLCFAMISCDTSFD